MRMHIPPHGRKLAEFTPGHKPSILVIDDEPDMVAALAKVLSLADYTCHCCHDVEGAIQCVTTNAPDLIISDINLGGDSGLRLCEQIKRDLGLSQIPVIFLSGAQIPDIIRRAHEAGGTYYLRKPFDPQVLLELVDKALWMPHLVSAVGRR
ncbi:MAG: response regulator [Pirellulales bacterium]|nr:response regulator [Pirellulales bacterium]